MIIKKLLLSSLIVISGTIASSCPMVMHEVHVIEANDDIVTDATFYTIHGYKHSGWCTQQDSQFIYYQTTSCVTAGRSPFMSKKTCPRSCPGRDLIDHDKDLLAVTYYDRNWKPLGIVDITHLNFQQSITGGTFHPRFGSEITNFKKIDYDKLRTQELITLHEYCRKHLDPQAKPKAENAAISKPYIIFYGFGGEEIAKFEYSGDFDASYKEFFGYYLDFTHFTGIRSNSCIVF